MLGFRNLEVEIKATSKTGARRMEVELLEGFPSLSAGDLQGSWRECGGSAEAAPQSFTQLHLVARHQHLIHKMQILNMVVSPSDGNSVKMKAVSQNRFQIPLTMAIPNFSSRRPITNTTLKTWNPSREMSSDC